MFCGESKAVLRIVFVYRNAACGHVISKKVWGEKASKQMSCVESEAVQGIMFITRKYARGHDVVSKGFSSN